MTDLPQDPNESPGYFFPGWIPRISKQRTLSYYDGCCIVTEHDVFLPAPNLSELYSLMFSLDLLVFVENMMQLPWLEQARIDYKAVLYASSKGIPTAVQMHGKKDRHHCTRWLISSAAWQQYTPTPTLLHRLRTLFDHCGVGVASTPSALGMALQKRAFYETHGENWTAHRHPLPPRRCVDDLREMSTGARSELFVETTQMIDAAWEIDMKNGYAAAFIEQPTGPTIAHRGRFLDVYPTFVSHCMVEIKEPLALGCFAVRVEQQRGAELFYPTAPGWYETLLWKEEIEIAEQAGCTVETGPGWGWLEMTRDNARFAELMTHLRDTAPESVVDWIKLAIVGSIGRHGSPWETTTLVPEGEQSPGDVEACFNGLAYDWYIHTAMENIPESMQHWFSHTLMKCRLELYKYALPYAQRGELLATNTDAVFVRHDADVSSVLPKEEANGKPAGTWRKSKLTKQEGKPMFPALRHVISEQKVRRPGVPKEGRE